MARCRKLVSPPLSPPARPWPSAGRDAGRPALSAALPAPLPAGGHTRPPPGGLPAACSSLALPLCFIGFVSCYGSVQEVSEPSLEFPRHSPVCPPGGSPVACSFLALPLFAACSLLVFNHFLNFTKMICYAIVIIDLRIFTFCPKSQIFLNKLCLSSWLKIAGYMFCNISPPKENRPHPNFG